MKINKDYKIIKVYKKDSAYLVEDRKRKEWVLKNNAPKVAVRFYEFLGKRNSPLLKYFPEHKKIEEPASYLRQHFEGEIAGNSTYIFGFSDEAFTVLDPEELTHVVKMIQDIPMSKTSQLSGLEVRDASWYIDRLVETKGALKTMVGKETYEKVKESMLKVKNIVDKETKYLANGDLHPKNILLLKNPKSDKNDTLQGVTDNRINSVNLGERELSNFVILDWDLLHINNPAYDLSFLYLWGWRNNSWRRKVYENVEMKRCFNFCVTYLSAQLIKHAKIILDRFIQDYEVERKKLAEEFLESMIESLLKSTK